jgi:hypothetical protein
VTSALGRSASPFTTQVRNPYYVQGFTALAEARRSRTVTMSAFSGGFALWPTNATAYGLKESPFFATTGRDIVAEFVSSVRKHDIEPCFYSE